MYCLCYLSTELVEFDSGTLKALVKQAEVQNDFSGITGYLFYTRQQFVQYLEGPEEDVRTLFHKIYADPRHCIEHTIESTIEARRFPSWSMKDLTKRMPDITVETILKNNIGHLKRLADVGAGIDTKVNEDIAWNMIDRLSECRAAVNRLTKLGTSFADSM